MTYDIHFNINLTEGQKELYDLYHSGKYEELVAVWSRQSGKTTICEILALEQMLSEKCNVGYISPSYAQGKKVYKEITDLLAGKNLIKERNATDLYIRLNNGSTLKFFSAKNPTAIRGQTISGLLIIDECAFLPEVTPDGQNLYHNIIKPITKAKKPITIFVSTPNGKSGIFYEKYLEGLKEDGKVKTIVCDIYRDSTMTPEEIALLKADTPPMAWKAEYLVQFLDSQTTAFEGFEYCFNKYNENVVNQGKKWIGVDFSANGEDETILTMINENNQTRQYLITGTLDMKYEKLAKIINETDNLAGAYLEANGIGEPMINTLMKLVKTNKYKLHYWTTTNTTKNAMVGLLQLKIANRQVMFNEEDKELYKQFGVFTFSINKKTRTISYAAKQPFHDDRIMSLLMAVQAKEDFKFSGTRSNYFTPDNITRIR